MRFVKPRDYFNNWQAMFTTMYEEAMNNEWPIRVRVIGITLLIPAACLGCLIGLRPGGDYE